MSNIDPTKTRDEPRRPRKAISSCLLYDTPDNAKIRRHENHYFISGKMDNDVPQCKSTTSKNNDLKNHRYNNGMPLNVSYLKVITLSFI